MKEWQNNKVEHSPNLGHLGKAVGLKLTWKVKRPLKCSEHLSL